MRESTAQRVQRPPALADDVSGMALIAGGANVIMQLSRLPVGHGVVESKVDSGNLYKRPIKRTRTTLAYLMTAMKGTPEERLALRKQIDQVHAMVRSSESSPVAYNAFDRGLQLWVAACIYRGAEDTYQAFVGEIDDATAESFYQEGKRFGTTLQVPEDMWPADRIAFQDYWNREIKLIELDDTTREYLRGIARLEFYGKLVSRLLGWFGEFVTTGFLYPPFREQMGLPWSEKRQRRFDAMLKVIRSINRWSPRVLREFPLNLIWWDTRGRIRKGKPVI